MRLNQFPQLRELVSPEDRIYIRHSSFTSPEIQKAGFFQRTKAGRGSRVSPVELPSFLPRQMVKDFNPESWVVDAPQIVAHSNGVTSVVLIKDKKFYATFAVCSDKDQFCRRNGLTQAIIKLAILLGKGKKRHVSAENIISGQTDSPHFIDENRENIYQELLKQGKKQEEAFSLAEKAEIV